MSMDEDRPTDEEIHRYVDGVADERSRALIERYIEDHPEELRRIDDFLRLNEALWVTWGKPAMDDPPPRIKRLQAQLARRLALRRLTWYLRPRGPAAVGTLAAAIFAGAVWLSGSVFWHVPPSYADEAVDAHLLFANDPERPVEVPGSRETELVRWLSGRLGFPVRVPDLSSAGLQLLGGRLVTNDTRPAAQLMYARADGSRITLYVTQADGTEHRVAEQFEGLELHFVCWQDGRAAYALVGRDRPDVLQTVSERVITALGATLPAT